ncbi:HPr(Ser) kinase/phosphatase [bacterium 210820-DFI.6.52]|uniref:HPr kinase/phosphorylase n=1 Tax=Bittarella massiliensis (ex Durand et al. 2017) TaxID=1720313 RepID=A0AAQ1MBP7_9FIRM|nr:MULTISPECIES: HPr(Ser) kinase/phosphatase [Eubacteriales]MCB5940908.1 HPr(Ser) kinase/phosphatase [bacterium 210820-DFI.6.52]ERJ00516.1 HPr(Ser) kinase/phosphatase [Clostridium sp. ATCC 29733]MZL69527.1 HPr(Ser) kinase/phosphatase [Bittarella massiliensis (ex Durand et al. 2017)]MZL80444.1 HPr(Ser) kinase/phosphatase [Bittarella massiliensis (ex Durand et al. 2017)]SHF77185.1 Hpr(Ser) kinase/phosphatase [Bittarella massiliensis (ex Durand et al. 2017)]
MEGKFSVSLATIVHKFGLEPIVMPKDPAEIAITVGDLNRPGLYLAGHHDFFDCSRIQLIGNLEYSYLLDLDDEARDASLCRFFKTQPVTVIFTRGLEIFESAIRYAEENGVPLLRTSEPTSAFMSGLNSLLNIELAPRITRHGVLVEVYGEGILLLGESGVGKSETAIELVKRGHRLIADDAVELRKTSTTTLVGTSPDNIRHFVELRGIGIVNVRRIFGIGSVKMSEKVDMIIHLEPWEADKNYDRIGLENTHTEILGIKIPSLTIPVKPGRNLAIIIEVAAMNNRQKRMGYNAARQLLTNLGMIEDVKKAEEQDVDLF